MKPRERSKLRLAAGKFAYTWRRYGQWIFGGMDFAKEIRKDNLSYLVFSHATPTLRKLKDVDMWLQHNKETNLKLAVRRLDGIVIHPGETLSYWKLIGNPTKRKGYVPGMVLFYGRFKPGIGGGLCQLSNLIYWLTLHTPLTITERHRHSYDVFPDSNRTQPFGSGATCSYNYLDLMIRNDTDSTYQLRVDVQDHQLLGEWRSTIKPIHTYEVVEKEHRISQEHWGGYVRHNIIHRLVFNDVKELVRDEFVAENRALMM
ncbi:VanW family protein [Paenibacillus mendelii]|uniref:VanW family protein n=1 Tax=Paenibacillus mendelii TaxID=206163 RepID=A0ABV6JCV5_9BACL|nr:VanW family protein [Paenibacillus mendelii]MCQ6562493.1 VanW family protein [Paenibacillus mendelii]